MGKLHDTFLTAEQAGHWIIEHSPDNPTTVSDVSEDLESVKKDIDEIDSELADLKQQYLLSVLDGKPFNVVLDDFANWLADVDRKLSKAKKLSASYSVVSKQNDKLQIIKNELKQLEPVHEFIANKTEEKAAEVAPDANIPKKLSQLKLYWTAVSEKLSNRENIIAGLLPAAEKQKLCKEKFVSYKNTVEQKLRAIRPVPAEEHEVRQQHNTLQVRFYLARFILRLEFDVCCSTNTACNVGKPSSMQKSMTM